MTPKKPQSEERVNVQGKVPKRKKKLLFFLSIELDRDVKDLLEDALDLLFEKHKKVLP